MPVGTELHPVLKALREPAEGDRVALVIEGGGMRGAVSGGMALALDELGLADRFDAAYGSSAGALNAMWLVSGRAGDGIHTWTDPELGKDLMNLRRIFGERPIVDMKTLIERQYEEISPGLFDSVLAAETEFHPLATDVATGSAVDLHLRIEDRQSLMLAIRASSTLPLIGGPPVAIGQDRYLDAGLSAAIPFQAAIDDGATHLLLLRSRRAGDITTAPSGLGGRLTSRLLGRISPAIRDGYLTRDSREGADEDLLASHDREPARSPSILQIRPDPESAVPSRLESDMDIVGAGLEAGRRAAHEALA